MNNDYSTVFSSLTASEISAMSVICAHSGGLHQHKTNKRFQSLVGRGLVYTQSVKNGHGIRYLVHDPVGFGFKDWVNNRSAIAS
jgi:hypothetical protein